MIASSRRATFTPARRRPEPRLRILVRVLVYACAGLLFLSAAATVDAGFTLRLSYLLAAAACALGAGSVLDGWRRLPFPVVVGGTGVIAAYSLAAALGDDRALPGSTRGGELRELVYLADLVLGLALAGLVVHLARDRRVLRHLVVLLVAAAAVASAYAVYQSFAKEHGWPLAHVNNTADSSGISSGAAQGDGYFGRERPRGTFLEPHFLAAFLSSLLPLAVALALVSRGGTRAAAVFAGGASLAAILLASSAPAWGVVALVLAAAALLWARARRTTTAAVACATAVILLVLFGATVSAAPERLGPLTGRSAQQMRITTDFRTTTWERVVDIWSTRPVLGFGPGQSSVQLTAASADPMEPGSPALQSAQGLWAASLIDAGLIGLGMWLVLLGAALATALAAALRRPTVLVAGVALAALAAVAGSQLAGDRLDLRTWLLLGLALAAAEEGDQRQHD